SWIDALLEYCSDQVTDQMMENAAVRFPVNTPTTKEAYFYRAIFHQYFPQESAAKTVKKWVPKWQENTDPSGRANSAHEKADTSLAMDENKLALC
ncbi:MAG: asparagine synthase B, partial [Flavobacteriaceae bacterium]|nr:asparagine synthase B [Flavobacteriaceae bacterium]